MIIFFSKMEDFAFGVVQEEISGFLGAQIHILLHLKKVTKLVCLLTCLKGVSSISSTMRIKDGLIKIKKNSQKHLSL